MPVADHSQSGGATLAATEQGSETNASGNSKANASSPAASTPSIAQEEGKGRLSSSLPETDTNASSGTAVAPSGGAAAGATTPPRTALGGVAGVGARGTAAAPEEQRRERAEIGSPAVTCSSSSNSSGYPRPYDHRRRGRAFSSALPPPPPQAPLGVGGGAGWTGLRDLDGCVVWYTESGDSAAEADIESLASRAESVDSREDDLEAAASTDSEVASTASSTGGASSVCSGDSSRNRARDRDLSLELCSTWSEEGEEDVLLGLSLARARMTAGKAACSCQETSCFCRFKSTSSFSISSRNLGQNPRTVALPPPGPLARSELDPRDLALVAEINCMAKGSRDRRGRDGGGTSDAAPGAASGARGAAAAGAGAGPAAAAAGAAERLAVHPDCAFEFAERFVRRDIALAGRVQAVRLLSSSTNAIFSVIVRCGGFRALYGWLGDVWERVRAHKLARAGPPDWRGVGGRVYVEELLCVLARVPISVDMLRETEIARVAKKFRRLAERHGLESMTTASNRLRAHLHAVVSRGVQDGLFFRNRAVRGQASAAVPPDFYRGSLSQQHFYHPSGTSLPYPSRRPEPWNSKEGTSWRTNGRVGGAVGFREFGGPYRGKTSTRDVSGGDGGSHSSGTHQNPPLPFSGMTMGNRPGLGSVRLRGWRSRQGGGDDGGDGASSRGGGSDAGSVRGEEEGRASDDGKQLTSNQQGSAGGSPSRESGRGEGEGAEDSGNTAAAGAVGSSPEVSSVAALRGSSSRSRRGAQGASRVVVGSSGGGSRGYVRRSSSRRRVSKTEPWVLDLSNSGREDEQRRSKGPGAEQNSPQQPAHGSARRGVWGEEAGWSRWRVGDGRMFRPLREEGGGFSDGRHPSNVSEDGSWEGTVDWWPRPRSPPPGAADAYYTPGEFESGVSGGMFVNPFPGPQGASSLLPAVPTFEESGTRVSWADHRGHSLAEVHEIEPGYSRGDFALPGHVGFITEACRRDMSKKEEQLLSPEDHERLAAAALESDVLRGRAYGGGAGGDSEGTISDSENSTTGDPDGGYHSSSSGRGGDGGGSSSGGGGSGSGNSEERRDRSASGDGSGGERSTGASSNPPLPHFPASSGGSQDGGSQDGGSQDGGSQDDASQYGGSQDGGDVGEHEGRQNQESGKEGDSRGDQRSSLADSDQRTSPKRNSVRMGDPHGSPSRRNLGSGHRREPGDEAGSESGCSSIHSPQRCFSPMKDDCSPQTESQSSTITPQRRFTSPSGRRSPPRSPSVSSPGSSRSGSVADGHAILESGESSDQSQRETVCRPPLTHNPWEHRHDDRHHHDRHMQHQHHQHHQQHHQQHRASARDPPPRWEPACSSAGAGARERRPRGMPISTAGDDLLGSTRGGRSARLAAHSVGSDNGRQLDQRVGRGNGGGSGDSSEGRRVDDGGSIPRPWGMNASISRGKPLWPSERGRVSEGRRAGEPTRRGGGGRVERLRGRRREADVEEEEEEEEEDEDEAYRRRATAAMLLGVKNKSAEVNRGGGDSSVSELSGSRDEQHVDRERTPPPLSPPSREVSSPPGSGRKRSYRDSNGDGQQPGLGSLAPLDGGCAAAEGARASSRGFGDDNDTRTPSWFKHRGGVLSPERGMDGRPTTRRRVETGAGGGDVGGKGEGVREADAETSAEGGGRTDRKA